MGLLDSVLGAVTGQLQTQGGLTGVLGDLLANHGHVGGLNGLVQKFQQAGLGDVVASWIGHGANLPVTQEQIAQVLGGETLGKVARDLGVDPDQASAQLSQWLPGVIDKLTPQGVAPQGGLGNASELLGALGGLLHKA